MRNLFVYAFAIVVLSACGDREEPGTDAGRRDAQADVDAHVELDAGGDEDAGGEDDAGGDEDAGTDAGGDEDAGIIADAGRVCMIGQVCGDTQPCAEGAEFRCYGFGESGFCAPFAPECGGFANIMCTGGRTCIRGGGGSLGYCATDEEMDCICRSSAENDIPTDGCPASYFPDAGEPPRP